MTRLVKRKFDYPQDGTIEYQIVGMKGATNFGALTPTFSRTDSYHGVCVGTHSPKPLYEGHEANPKQKCHILEGACYWTESVTRGQELCKEWLANGQNDDIIYGELIVVYETVFDQAFLKMVGSFQDLTEEN